MTTLSDCKTQDDVLAAAGEAEEREEVRREARPKFVKSAVISFAGDRSAGILPSTFELTGGDFILDLDAFAYPEFEAEKFRAALQRFASGWLCDEPASVYLVGYDPK